MSAPGRNLNTLGRTYEVRGNGAAYIQWRDKPLYGWITHMPAGWVFTPAPGIPYMPDGLFYSDFEDAFPHWTGGPRANDKRGVIDSLKAMRDA